MKRWQNRPRLLWALAGGAAFLAARFSGMGEGTSHVAVAAAVMLMLGFIRGRRLSTAIVWMLALLIAASAARVVAIDYAVHRWYFIAAMAGAIAGLAEPGVEGRNRLLNALAWSAALPVAMFAGIVVMMFLDQPLDAIVPSGFLIGIFLGGAVAGKVAYSIGALTSPGASSSSRPSASSPRASSL